MDERLRRLQESLDEADTHRFLQKQGLEKFFCDEGSFSPGPLIYVLENAAREREEHFSLTYLPSMVWLPTPIEIIADRVESHIRVSGEILFYAVVGEKPVIVRHTRKSYAQYMVNLRNFFRGDEHPFPRI